MFKKHNLEDTQELHIPPYKKGTKSHMYYPLVAKIGILLAVLLAVILFLRYGYLTFLGRSLTLLNEEQPTFYGTNGQGTIEDSFHPEQDALDILLNKKDYLTDSEQQDLQAFYDSISCSFSQTDNLKNGMTVSYACTFNPTYAKKAGYRPQNTTKEYTVHGLDPYQTMDPYQDLEVTYSYGTNGIEPIIQPSSLAQELSISYTCLQKETSLEVYAHYDLDTLHAKGYTIAQDSASKSFPLPQKITSQLQLQSINLSAIEQQLRAKTEEYLQACQNRILFGKDILYITASSSITWNQDSNGQWTATIDLQAPYSETGIGFYHYTIVWSMNLYQEEEGIHMILHEKDGGCTFYGQKDNYTLDPSY